jgi:hypothetical protein
MIPPRRRSVNQKKWFSPETRRISVFGQPLLILILILTLIPLSARGRLRLKAAPKGFGAVQDAGALFDDWRKARSVLEGASPLALWAGWQVHHDHMLV